MSAGEIRRLAEDCHRKAYVYGQTIERRVELNKESALLAYAAMVERCEERIAHYSREIEDHGQSCVEMGREEMANKRMCSELNYILKGATDERK